MSRWKVVICHAEIVSVEPVGTPEGTLTIYIDADEAPLDSDGVVRAALPHLLPEGGAELGGMLSGLK